MTQVNDESDGYNSRQTEFQENSSIAFDSIYHGVAVHEENAGRGQKFRTVLRQIKPGSGPRKLIDLPADSCLYIHKQDIIAQIS